MVFNFFTFGGSQFWADVFFYQKWRIQVNSTSKTCRLLDPWDIVREKGTFEKCRKAFLKYIEIYELPRQKGHMIIMLHGYGQNKNVFKPLWRNALSRGYLAAAVNYPSMQCNLETNVKQLIFFLNNLEDVEKVSFVTKGAGGIILRKLFSIKAPWQKKLKVGRIVMVSPPNRGNRFLYDMSKLSFTRWIFGPMSAELSKKKVREIPQFDKNLSVGIVYPSFFSKAFSDRVPNFVRKYLFKKKDVALEGATEIVQISTQKWNPFKNNKISNAVMNFLDKGKFK